MMRQVFLLVFVFGVTSCQRVTEFCESKSDCPEGWVCGAADRCVEAQTLCPLCPAATCQEIKERDPSSTDGDYNLYFARDAKKPWRAFCYQMDSAPDGGGGGRGPSEYLNVTAERNYSMFPPGGPWIGTAVVTRYARVRLDPLTLLVDANDQTFAQSSGSLRLVEGDGASAITAMPYGVAMDCIGPGSAKGVAQIDVSGSPFIVMPNAFSRGGQDPGGGAQYAEDHKRVSLSGGGSCGWVAGAGAVDPYNQDGVPVQLRYPSLF